MNIEQWVSCIAEAYKTVVEAFSPRKKEMLLEELPEDDVNINQDIKDIINETVELLTRYFFKKVTLRETFGSIAGVEQRFGRSLEANYDISSGPFIDMAKTYWTYHLEIQDIAPKYHSLVLTQVLFQVNGDIASVFFPTPGPAIIWVRQRRETQRELLEEYAPGMDINAFLGNNPLLGTSKGRIAEAVFNEKVWVRCPNPSCLRFLKIPNTVKRLEITCPKCKKSFLFPAEELLWLNHLAPHFHPTPRKIKELEDLRQLWSIPDEVFAMGIIGTYWATEQLQRKLYDEAKQMNPRASDKEIFKEMIASRTENRIPLGLDMDEEEIDKAVESISSIDNLVDFVLSKESEEVSAEPPWPDPFGVRTRIEEILRG